MEYQNPIPLLREHHLHPKKELGQNFLVDSNILTRIVELAEVTGSSTVLEIGAGLGSLTFFLAQTARRVIAVEVDEDLLPVARQELNGFSNVQLIPGDILELDLLSLSLPAVTRWWRTFLITSPPPSCANCSPPRPNRLAWS